MDGNGAVIGGDTDIVFPGPRQPGPLQRFTSETTLTALYEGQRFAVRSDGIVQRMSPAHVVGAASCNLRPPLLYGVFRAMVTPPPQIKATGEREQKPFALSLPLSQNR
jgi:hypothetical protein